MKQHPDVVEALRSLVDGLRSGLSLRQAVVRSVDVNAGRPGSPLAPVATALAAGHPLAGALHAAAAGSDDADLRSALCVLAVHAEAGGDPLPACKALAQTLARRFAAREEARSLTTQARLGARATLLLTPAFLVLLALADPGGAARWFSHPRTRAAVALGLLLQALGAVWIGAIVNGVADPRARFARVPLVRAVRAILCGKQRPTIDAEIADLAEMLAFALDAGLAPTVALAAVAPHVGGSCGDTVRTAVARVGGASHESVHEAVVSLGGRAGRRFADAFVSSVTLGVPLAPGLRSLAEEVREEHTIGLGTDVRRASMRVLLPLAVVVLPAFVLACLVPLFAGGLDGIAG